jgi:uncharacterized protein YfkK (UPF0435 family)
MENSFLILQFKRIREIGHQMQMVNAKLLKKSSKKNEDQFDLFWFFGWRKRRHQFYHTLENTEHSYQIVQGDLGEITFTKFKIKLQFVLIPKLLD